MRTPSRALLILTIVCGFLVFVFLTEAQRSRFGEQTGNMLFYTEAAVAACVYVAYWLWKKGRRLAVIAGGWFVGALLAGFLGWFVHPKHSYARAFDRVSYLYRYMGSDASDRAKKRIQVELEARALEHEAAKLRFDRDPHYCRPTIQTWSLWVLSAIMALNGTVALLAKRKCDEHFGTRENPRHLHEKL